MVWRAVFCATPKRGLRCAANVTRSPLVSTTPTCTGDLYFSISSSYCSPPMRTGDLVYFRFCISLFLYLITRHKHTCKGEIFFCISLFYCPKAQYLHLQRWIVSLLFFNFVFLDLIARHVWIRVKQEIPLSHISQTYISRVKQEIPLSYILSAQHMFQRHWYRRVLPIHSGPRGGSWQVLDCHLYPLY